MSLVDMAKTHPGCPFRFTEIYLDEESWSKAQAKAFILESVRTGRTGWADLCMDSWEIDEMGLDDLLKRARWIDPDYSLSREDFTAYLQDMWEDLAED